MSPSPRRRWFLLGCTGVVVLVMATAVALFTTYRVWRGHRQAQQRAAAVKVEALGGWVQHSFSSASNPLAIWLESGDAPNIFSLSDRGLGDNDLRFLNTAPTTRGLFLFNNRLTDQGLVHLKDLHDLDTLDLRRNSAITDAGLVDLENLKNLKLIYLMGTSVTLTGVNKLQAKLPQAKIHHSAGP